MRCFIAIDIPEDLKEKINEFQSDLEKMFKNKIKFVEKENLHITLKFLGEINEKELEKLKRILESIKFSPFKVRLKEIGFFPDEKFIRVIWIGGFSDGKLEEISKIINEKLKKENFYFDERFSPHLTIGRVKEKIDITKINREIDFGEFTVKEIKLKKSTLTQEGPIYEDLVIKELE
ncbi:MAG: RNA 2',3'-cyclic phosphodiesterase [Candidatus Micrarchaeia archaeon]